MESGVDDEGEMIRKWERKFSQKRKRARDTASFPAAVRREKKREGREGKTEREKGGEKERKQ